MNAHYTDDSLALHTDLYELNMIHTYWEKGLSDRHAVFECYYRRNPFGNGYTIVAGLERIVSYIQGLRFTDTDLAYLRDLGDYSEEFLTYLKNWQFKGTIRAMKEGETAFANEPLLQVEGPLADCQLIETALLNILNFQTLIATKASELKRVAGEDPILEFGARRAQEMDAALWGARSAYIGGVDATSNTRAGKKFGIPVSGTHAHSFVQMYGDDYKAFKAYAETHKKCVFLVDTYNTLESGVPSAIRVAREMGDAIEFLGVRLDSGDLSYLSKRVRQQLDEAGFTEAKVFVSNDIDTQTMLNLKMQGAKIDVWGIGTRLITAYDEPALGIVYKLVSVEKEDGTMEHTMKLTSNVAKITTPGKKQVWRIVSKDTGRTEGDYIGFSTEQPDETKGLYLFHPQHPYINKTVTNFTARPLLVDIFVEGELVYDLPSLEDIKAHATWSLHEHWEEYTRTLNPEPYPVDLSQKLYDTKMGLIQTYQERYSSK